MSGVAIRAAPQTGSLAAVQSLPPAQQPATVDCRVKVERFLRERFRWNTSEEIYAVLTSVDQHGLWLNAEVAQRPPNGSMLLYDRRQVNYRNDGYLWKKRKDGKQIREDHMKLKVKGEECIYGCYVHSALLPSFHRRCYWLLDNPDIILVHYLNVPVAGDKGRLSAPLLLQPTVTTLNAAADRTDRRWTPAEILAELEPMQRLPRGEANGTHASTAGGDPLKLFNPPLASLQCLKSPAVASTAQWILNVSSQSSVSHLVIVNGSAAAAAAAVAAAGAASGSVTAQQPPVSSSSAAVSPAAAPIGQSDRFLPAAAAQPGDRSPAPENIGVAAGIQPADATSIGSSSSTFATGPLSHQEKYPSVCYGEDDHPGDLDSILFANNVSSMVDMSVDELGSILLDHRPAAADHHHQHHHVPAGIGGDGDIAVGRPPYGCHMIDDIDIFDCWPSDECLGGECSSSSAAAAMLTETSAQQQQQQPLPLRGVNAPIEFAPHWGLTSGGDKLLVVGPWTAANGALVATESRRFSCRFGGVGAVPAELVLDGILRCTIPASAKEQTVQLQIERDGLPIAVAGIFEYRSSSCCQEKSTIMDWFSTTDAMRLLRERLEAIDRYLAASRCTPRRLLGYAATAAGSEPTPGGERALCELGEAAAVDLIRQWQLHTRSIAHVDADSAASPIDQSSCGLTLVHAAAALDYGRLIEAAAEWRITWLAPGATANGLARELSISSADERGCTPLHWACALGKHAAAESLLHCANYAISNGGRRGEHGSPSIHSPNAQGLQPVAVARLAGHRVLADHVAAAMHADVVGVDFGLFRHPLGDNFVLDAPIGRGVTQAIAVGHRCPDDGICSCSATGAAPAVRKSASRRASTPLQHQPGVGAALRMKRQSSLCSAREDFESCLRPASSDPLIACGVQQQHRLSPLAARCGSLGAAIRSPSDVDFVDDVETVSDEDMPSLDEEVDDCVLPTCCVDRAGAIPGSGSASPGSSPCPSRMRSLAEQIIAAMPERIKTSSAAAAAAAAGHDPANSCDVLMPLPSSRSPPMPAAATSGSFLSYRDCSSSSHSSYSDSSSSIVGCCSTSVATAGTSCDDSGIATPMLGSLDELRPISPPTTAEEFSEYFNANAAHMERYFSSLTLSDVEQRRLYEAAKIIQNAYRLFKDKKQQHQREIEAAVIIQTYYRRYKKYKYQMNVQQMQQAAVRIQSQFRTYSARKRFRQSREAALVIQHQYRAYRESERAKKQRQCGRTGSAASLTTAPAGIAGGVALLPQHSKLRALSSRHRFKEPGTASINYSTTTAGAATSGERSSER